MEGNRRLTPCEFCGSRGNRLKEFTFTDGQLLFGPAERIGSLLGEDIQISGYYARYLEGTFTFFADDNDEIYIGWQKKCVSVREIDRIELVQKYIAIRFICYDKDGVVILEFSYQTALRYLINPLLIPSDFLLDVTSDAWYHTYVLCNYPSDVCRWFQNGKSVDDFDALVNCQFDFWCDGVTGRNSILF